MGLLLLKIFKQRERNWLPGSRDNDRITLVSQSLHIPWVHENNSFTYIKILHVVLRIIKTHYNFYTLPSASITLLQDNPLVICLQ